MPVNDAPTDEMERASCSDSCPGLFSQLKEVYLFGCNTLNPGASKSASAERRRLVNAKNSWSRNAETKSGIDSRTLEHLNRDAT